MGSVDDTSSYEDSSSQITDLKKDKKAEHGFRVPIEKERTGSVVIPRPSQTHKIEKKEEEDVNMDAIDEESFSYYSDQDGKDDPGKSEGEV